MAIPSLNMLIFKSLRFLCERDKSLKFIIRCIKQHEIMQCKLRCYFETFRRHIEGKFYSMKNLTKTHALPKLKTIFVNIFSVSIESFCLTDCELKHCARIFQFLEIVSLLKKFEVLINKSQNSSMVLRHVISLHPLLL